MTALQRAIVLALSGYEEGCELLDPAGRAVLRSVVASRLARDSAQAIEHLDQLDAIERDDEEAA
jgi:hypothetical protein